MDEADRAQQDIEVQEAHKPRSKWHPEAVAIGTCLYCGANVLPHIRWCCPECAWSWEYERSRHRVNGTAG